MFHTVQVLHAQGKISRSDIWIKESEFSEVPVLPPQIPWLEKCQLSLETCISLSVFITILLVPYFVVAGL